MQAVMEIVFDAVYLVTVITLGIGMLCKSSGRKQVVFYGVMAVVLGFGDAFHLVPRAYFLCAGGLAGHEAALGFGKFITSITMTLFYVLLYEAFCVRSNKKNIALTMTVYILAAARIILCLFPQNGWLRSDAPLSWAIARNVPFALLGLLIIILAFREAFLKKDEPFRFLWLAVTLSFAFYIPVVLCAGTYPLVGMLMIPKTCMYVWIVVMTVKAAKMVSRV